MNLVRLPDNMYTLLSKGFVEQVPPGTRSSPSTVHVDSRPLIFNRRCSTRSSFIPHFDTSRVQWIKSWTLNCSKFYVFAAVSDGMERNTPTRAEFEVVDKGLLNRMSSALQASVVKVKPSGDNLENLKTSIKRYQVLCESTHKNFSYTKYVIHKEVDLLNKTFRSDDHRRMSQTSFMVEARTYSRLLPALNALDPPIGSPQAFDIHVTDNNEQFDFLLQDMEAEDSNYRDQHMALGMKQAETAVRWLAALHAYHWNSGSWADEKLWEQGGYWTLDKRHEDLATMERDWDVVVANWKDVYPDVFTDPRICQLGTRLRQSARNVSERLAERWPEHRTLIHGDFKTANLFFDGDADAMVALDWQWCGGGLGVMDLQYLLRTSCALEVLHNEEHLLRCYHTNLVASLTRFDKRPIATAGQEHTPSCDQSQAAEAARGYITWEELQEQYALACVDYGRFLVGGMWRQNTPETCARNQHSINQGMHKRCPDVFVWIVRQLDAMLEALDRGPEPPAI